MVTGASSGIGAALAEELGRAGARLLLSGRDAARLAETAARAAGATQMELVTADLAEESELRSLAARAAQLFAHLDILVHSAGALAWSPVAATPVAELDRQLAVNLRAPFLLTQLLLPLLKRGRGQIVFINSRTVDRPAPGMASYAASKGGLRAFADCLREELAGDGVRVLSVFPGRTATPMQEELRRLEGLAYDPEGLLRPQDVAALVLAALALPARAAATDLHLRPGR